LYIFILEGVEAIYCRSASVRTMKQFNRIAFTFLCAALMSMFLLATMPVVASWASTCTREWYTA